MFTTRQNQSLPLGPQILVSDQNQARGDTGFFAFLEAGPDTEALRMGAVLGETWIRLDEKVRFHPTNPCIFLADGPLFIEFLHCCRDF